MDENHTHRRVDEDFENLKKKIDDHLVKEALEDVRMAVMEETLKHQGEKIEETKDEITAIFKILSEIKTLMIQRKA